MTLWRNDRKALGVSVHWSMALLTELMERWVPFLVPKRQFSTASLEASGSQWTASIQLNGVNVYHYRGLGFNSGKDGVGSIKTMKSLICSTAQTAKWFIRTIAFQSKYLFLSTLVPENFVSFKNLAIIWALWCTWIFLENIVQAQETKPAIVRR